MHAEDDRRTVQARLAMSRRALVEQWLDSDPASPDLPERARSPGSSAAPPPRRPRRRSLAGDALRAIPWMPAAQHVAGRWWQRHPVNAATQLARPLLERYAREQPVKLMAAAAATGALLVLLRPWRLLSVGALAGVLFQGSDLADMVTSVLARPAGQDRADDDQGLGPLGDGSA